MTGPNQSIFLAVAGVALRARSIALALLRPALLIALALFVLGALFVVRDAFSTGSQQASASDLDKGTVSAEFIAAANCATPNPEATIAYDDGLSDFGLVGSGLITIAANRFCVASPANVVSARLYLVGPILRPIRVHVLDAGFRSAFSLDITPQFDNWLEVDFTSANVSVDGNFYIGLQWLELFDNSPRPYLGVDRKAPHHDASFLGTLGAGQASPRAGEDFMIRVVVRDPSAPPAPAPAPTPPPPAPVPTPPPDDDGDGVSNANDLCPNTSPAEVALVGADGCSPSPLDVGETPNGPNPVDPTDASLDTVNDGQTNSQRLDTSTDPNGPDADADGFPDAVEAAAGSDPQDASSTPPTDGTVSLLAEGSDAPRSAAGNAGAADNSGSAAPSYAVLAAVAAAILALAVGGWYARWRWLP